MKAKFFQRMPIKWKFVISVVVIVFFLSLIQHIVFYHIDKSAFTKNKAVNLTVLAEVLADNSTSTVQFRDQQDALELLSSLRQAPSIHKAYLFDEQMQVLAAYSTDSEIDVPIQLNLADNTVNFFEDWISVQRSVVLNEKIIGALYVLADLDEIKERGFYRAVYGTLALLIAGLGAFLIAIGSQKFLLKQVTDLSRLSQRISKEKNYALRAEKTADDELGQLAENFNFMLHTIQARDEALAQRTQALESSNKELEQFAYVVSHDLKTPLVTIEGFSGRFMRYLHEGNQEKAEDSAMRVQKASKRMGELIDDVLQLSRIGRRQVERRKLNLNLELEQLQEDLKGALETAGAILTIDADLPDIYADHGEIRQVFQNLISNAIKYACVEPGKRIHVGSVAVGDENHVFVRDQGPGIPAEYHSRVFQLFQRLNTSKPGTGLGLAIVNKVMKGLSGRVWVESKDSTGSTFWLAFPKLPQAV